MKLEIDFPQSVAGDIVRQAREKNMEPQHWVQHFVMQKMHETQHSVSDAKFDAVAAYVLEKNAPLMEALARSEREDAAMAPEELALRYPIGAELKAAYPRTSGELTLGGILSKKAA